MSNIWSSNFASRDIYLFKWTHSRRGSQKLPCLWQKKTLSSRNSRALGAAVLQQRVVSQIKHFHQRKKFRKFVLCFNPRSRFSKKKNSKIVQYFHSDTASKNRAMQAAPMTVTSSTLISVCVSLEGTLMLIRAYRHCSLKPIHVVHVLCLSLPAHCFTRFHISKVTEADKQRKWARKMQGYFSM